jgi:hypothetical protein
MEVLEKSVKYSANILLLLTFVIFVALFIKREKLLPFSTKWIIYLFGCISIYVLVEWTLVNIIFRKSFFYFHSIVLPIIKFWGLKDMNFLAPLSYLIKFIFLSLFFRDLFQNPLKKRFFQYLMYALVLFELVMVFVFKSYQGYDSLSSTVKNVFILGSTGLFMYKLYRADSHGITLYKNPYFWLTLGLMLPALAEIFLEFIFTKLYQTDLLSFYKLYLVRNASQIVGFTLLIVGVWQAKYLRFLPKEY